jgi:hypothetical protein
MGFFNSWKSHYFTGYVYGLLLRFEGDENTRESILALDQWAYEREWAQNQAGQNPNDPMSPHQMEEAAAWGAGARAATKITDLPYPAAYNGYDWDNR